MQILHNSELQFPPPCFPFPLCLSSSLFARRLLSPVSPLSPASCSAFRRCVSPGGFSSEREPSKLFYFRNWRVSLSQLLFLSHRKLTRYYLRRYWVLVSLNNDGGSLSRTQSIMHCGGKSCLRCCTFASVREAND